MVWRWSLIIYPQDFDRDAEFGRHILPIPCTPEPQVSQQSQFLVGWGMSAQTLSPNTFLEHQNTKAKKSCNDSGPAVTACPGPTGAHGKMGLFYPSQINLPRYFLAGERKEDKAGHAGAPLTLVGPSSALSLSWARRLREKSWQQTTKRLLHFSSKGFTSGSIPEKSSL